MPNTFSEKTPSRLKRNQRQIARPYQRLLLLIAVLLPMGILLINPIEEASAHDMDHHGDHMDAAMKNLHIMMPMFSNASAELGTAIEKGDKVAAKTQIDKMLVAIPDLKKSKPHKNRKQLAEFKSLATKLGEDITKVGVLAEKGNFASARLAYRDMEARCNECHRKFRDGT
jgi:cytochrome c556